MNELDQLSYWELWDLGHFYSYCLLSAYFHCHPFPPDISILYLRVEIYSCATNLETHYTGSWKLLSLGREVSKKQNEQR